MNSDEAMSGVMQQQSSCSPNELREYAEEDLRTERLIHAGLIDPSSSEVKQHAGRVQWGPVQIGQWMTLLACIKLIAPKGRLINPSPSWEERLLDSLTTNPTMEQLSHLLNGYADLYQMRINLIPFNERGIINEDGIDTYQGTGSQGEGTSRYGLISFIMCNRERSQFAPLFIIDSNKQIQSCFSANENSIIRHMHDFVRKHDGKQRASLESNPENVNRPPPTESNCRQETDRRTVQSVTTMGRVQTNVELTSQSNTQPTANDEHDVTMVCRQVPTDTASFIAATHANFTSREQFADQIKSVQYDMAHRGSVESHDRPDSFNKGSRKGSSSLSRIVVLSQAPIQLPPSTNEPHAIQIFLSQSIISPLTAAEIEPTTSNSLSEKFESPEILKQPKEHRRVRMLTDVAKGTCPLVQAGEKKSQRVYPETAVPPREDGEELWLCVRVVSETGLDHPLKCVTPEDARVDFTLTTTGDERVCLQCDVNSFDPTTECVFLEVTTDERKKRRKIIKVRLFNWKQFGTKNRDGTDGEDLRLCKLELRFCVRISGQYHPVSPPSFTTLIEDVDGDIFIDPSTIEPKQLCELGGERIIVPLSVKCPKKGFQIFFDETKLTDRSFAMEKSNLVFKSPAKTEDENLHLIVAKSEKVENDPERRTTELYNGYIPYVRHGAHLHTCSTADPMRNNTST